MESLTSVREFLSSVLNWNIGYWWLVVIILVVIIMAYLVLIPRYWYRARLANKTILLAPITVKGGIPEQVGANEVGLIIRSHLFRIRDTLQKVRTGPSTFYTATALGGSFRIVQSALAAAPIKINLGDVEVPEELVLKIGAFQIPIGALVNLFKKLVYLLPVFFKNRYLTSLIHVSLVAVQEETELLVHHGGRRALPSGQIPDKIASNPTVLSKTSKVTNLVELNSLLRESAFMILKLYGQAFPRRGGQSMMHFTDGLDALDRFRGTGDRRFITEAENCFSRSSAFDENHPEALYFYGSMLLYRRTRESIAGAIRAYGRAAETVEEGINEVSNKITEIERNSETKGKGRENLPEYRERADAQRLLALIYTGLANCYAQQIHRLAKRCEDVMTKAENFIGQAEELWKNACRDKMHPWILQTRALVSHVEETPRTDKAERKTRYLEAARLYLKGLETEPRNEVLHNNIGWIFLKLTEWEEPELTAGDNVPEQLVGAPAEIADGYLHKSLELDPRNKLTHANLCLLYATPYYRAQKDNDHNMYRCRYHGLKAIQIDPNYINGYRDLFVSLLHYRKFDEAFEKYKKALELAAVVEKDLEIINAAVQVLTKIKVSKKELRRWSEPDPKLLEPPDRGSA